MLGGPALRRAGVTLLSLLVAIAATPAGALAQSGSTSPLSLPGSTSPFSPGLPQSTPSVTTTSTPTISSTSTSSDSGLTGAGIAAIAIGALIVLGGISFFIWYDARRKAPVRAAAYGGVDGRGRTGSKPKPKPRKPSPAERRRRKRGRAR